MSKQEIPNLRGTAGHSIYCPPLVQPTLDDEFRDKNKHLVKERLTPHKETFCLQAKGQSFIQISVFRTSAGK